MAGEGGVCAPPAQLRRRLESLGVAWIEEPAALRGVGLRGAWRPPSLQQLAAVLRLAAEEGLPVLPVGSGTKLHVGSPPVPGSLAISSWGLTGVVEYEPADLTVTVRAGTRLAELQAVLAEGGQFLPLDPPWAAEATLGGIVATAADGPLRLHYGGVRDQLLGVTVVQPGGAVTRAGSRVVKSVAGYDLPKLYTGSWGTLVFLAELTFKLAPLPPAQRTVLADLPLEGALGLAAELARSPFRPLALELMNATAAGSLTGGAVELAAGRLLTAMLLGGRGEVVERLERETAALVAQRGGVQRELEPHALEGLWSGLREFETAGELVLRLAVPPAGLGAALAAAEALGEGLGRPVSWTAAAGLAVILVCVDGATDAAASAPALLALRARLRELGGSLTVLGAPPGVRQRVPTWDDPGPAGALMKRLKEQLDHTGIMSPGRFLGGL